ncbi:hypothetical protein AUJ46_01325 [Candidatus Peregrinibacteria bacterium CG1_02_54_53]|nr:MAG: hypothetical protein AUJ46_01325 [Candidatus Peregrinibacteria bacterium CG1_02_54_53]
MIKTPNPLQATLTCPKCGHGQQSTLPTGACMPFYVCRNCKAMIKAKDGDCCVFCSYGDRPCPLKSS